MKWLLPRPGPPNLRCRDAFRFLHHVGLTGCHAQRGSDEHVFILRRQTCSFLAQGRSAWAWHPVSPWNQQVEYRLRIYWNVHSSWWRIWTHSRASFVRNLAIQVFHDIRCRSGTLFCQPIQGRNLVEPVERLNLIQKGLKRYGWSAKAAVLV